MTSHDNKAVSDYLLTKHLLINSLCLIALNDLKEHIQLKDKQLYNGIRNNLNKCKSEQQMLHDLYSKIIANSSEFFGAVDELNNLIDKFLLKTE